MILETEVFTAKSQATDSQRPNKTVRLKPRTLREETAPIAIDPKKPD